MGTRSVKKKKKWTIQTYQATVGKIPPTSEIRGEKKKVFIGCGWQPNAWRILHLLVHHQGGLRTLSRNVHLCTNGATAPRPASKAGSMECVLAYSMHIRGLALAETLPANAAIAPHGVTAQLD